MHVFSIQVTASRGFNHPSERFANFRPIVTLHASLAEGEDVDTATAALFAQADALAEAAKQKTLADIAAEEARTATIDALEWQIRELLLQSNRTDAEERALCKSQRDLAVLQGASAEIIAEFEARLIALEAPPPPQCCAACDRGNWQLGHADWCPLSDSQKADS